MTDVPNKRLDSENIQKAPEKSYLNTTIPKELQRSLRMLAAREGQRMNTLLEEAIMDLLKKYDGAVHRDKH